jgi:metal transporter CNNM
MDYFIVIFLVILSGLFSGLTLGFFSLDRGDLKRKADLGNEKAKKVLPIRESGNLLLCTLLIGNVAVNSALSIFLGSIASGFVAGLIATALIVVFGEIIPQASFSRYALIVGSKLAWLVRIFIIVFYIICKPMALILDKVLGEEIPTVYSKHELMKIVEEHEDSKDSDLDSDEEKIIKGALSFSYKVVRDIMTPRTEAFCLGVEDKLNKTLIGRIYRSGNSRIPVYEGNSDNIIGILFTKELINEKYHGKKVGNAMDKDLLFVDHQKNLDDLLNAFRKNKIHLAIVTNEYNSFTGVVTIEDVIEEIIGYEIVDEFDRHEDMQKLAKEKALKLKINKV